MVNTLDVKIEQCTVLPIDYHYDKYFDVYLIKNSIVYDGHMFNRALTTYPILGLFLVCLILTTGNRIKYVEDEIEWLSRVEVIRCLNQA